MKEHLKIIQFKSLLIEGNEKIDHLTNRRLLILINVTIKIPIDFNFSGNSNFTIFIQILSIISSLLSLSFSFTTWRIKLEKEEGEKWTWKDTAGDFVWNALTVIPRVITLALFATYQLYWFRGLIGGQIVLSMMIFPFLKLESPFNRHSALWKFLLIFFISISMVFTIVGYSEMKFYVYILYLVFAFVENTVMISLWFEWVTHLQLWYHNIAMACIIAGCVFSLIVKTIHCYFRNDRKLSICEWHF